MGGKKAIERNERLGEREEEGVTLTVSEAHGDRVCHRHSSLLSIKGRGGVGEIS